MVSYTKPTFEQPLSGTVIFANPLLNSSEAMESILPLRQFIVEELRGNFTSSVEPSYGSFYNKYSKSVVRQMRLPDQR